MEAGQSQEEEEVASECHQRAQQALLQGNYGRAFAHYLLLVRMSPSLRAEVKENLTLALREWAEQLEGAGRGHDVLACYQQACDVFPDCETMLSNMGAHLFSSTLAIEIPTLPGLLCILDNYTLRLQVRLGYIDEAACCFRRALRINPDFLGARENLDNVCGHLVERWHFRMLNDVTRNSKFRDAIHAAVENGHGRVLDIGTGTGLLVLFAVEAGATDIYGCEMSKTMYDVACDVLRTNQAAEKVSLMHKKSTDLKIPDDIPERVTLVVTETVDAGLLGEHILATLQHAWKHLLVPNDEKQHKKGTNRASRTGKPKSCVIPAGATVYIAGIESEYIRRHNRLLYPGLRHVDLSEVDITCRTGQANSYQGEEEASEWEPYTTERLNNLPGGYKLLTDVTEALQLDFNNARMIETYLQGAAHDLVLPVTRQGRLDAIALWFDLELYDNIMMSTSPEAESCWEQAVYPALPSHLQSGGRDSLLVKPGESLQVTCTCSNNALSLQCTELRPTSTATASISAATTTTSGSLLCQYNVQPQPPIHVHIPIGSSSTDLNTQTDPVGSDKGAAGGGESVNVPPGHNYDLTICKPEQSGTYLYQQGSGASGAQDSGLSQMLPPPYGQLPPPHVGLPPPPPPLLGTQPAWQHPGPWYQDLVWPHHQVQQAWPHHDPRLWPQPQQYQQQQRAYQQPQYQTQQQQYQQPTQPQQQHQQQPHHQQLQPHRNDSPHRPDTSESHEPPPYLPLPVAYSNISANPMSSFPTATSHSPRSPHVGVGGGSGNSVGQLRGDILPAPPAPQSEYTNFLRQQLRDAVHAAEMDATYRSFVIRSQTAPDVRVSNSLGSSGSSVHGSTKAVTPSSSTAKDLMVTPSGSSVWSQWTWGQPISRSVDSLVTAAKQGYLNNTPKETFLLDRYELSRLNDIDSNTAFCSALEKVKKNHFSGKGFTMLDLTRGFSSLPLQSLKIGASEVGIMETASQTQTELLCCLAPANGLTPSAVRFLCGSIEEVEAEWDVVVTELIDHCGALTQQVLEQIALARVTCLRPGGIVIPWAATVYGMVVEATALLNDSAVISDEHTLDLQIAQFMNDFQMTTHVDITLNTLSYKKLSQPFELFTFNFNERTPSKVPDFLNQSSTVTLNAIDSGQVTAVIYWFELLLTPEVKLSTVDTKLRWRQAAVMQKARPDVLTGRPMTVKAVCKNSCIDIKVQLN